MIYRLAKIEDVEEIDILCKREGIATPSDGTTIIAENDDKIVGFINFASVTLVNCFVSDSSHAAETLYEKMMTVLEMAGQKRIMMFPKNTEVESLAIKKGFKITNRDINTMEKIL